MLIKTFFFSPYKNKKSCPLIFQGTGVKSIIPAVPPKLILKSIRLILILSYKSELVTGTDFPLTATNLKRFSVTLRSPFTKNTKYYLSANGNSLKNRSLSYLLFFNGLFFFCYSHYIPVLKICQEFFNINFLFSVKSRVECVEILAVKFVLNFSQSLAETLIMNYFTFTQKFNRITNIRVVNKS